MQKTCPRCQVAQPLSAFNRRTLSPGGYAAACRACTNEQKRLDYWGDPEQNRKQRERSVKNRTAKIRSDPAYKRAFYLWNDIRRRSKIPPWVCMKDFVPICQEAITLGPEYELDHIIPLKGKLVSGLHVPSNIRVVLKVVNQAKGNKFVV